MYIHLQSIRECLSHTHKKSAIKKHKTETFEFQEDTPLNIKDRFKNVITYKINGSSPVPQCNNQLSVWLQRTPILSSQTKVAYLQLPLVVHKQI